MRSFRKHHQQGAALFVALILLLIVSLLAISNVREVGLEAKITGQMLEQKRLMSASEAALREGENRIAQAIQALDKCSGTLSSANPCIVSMTDNYRSDFSSSFLYSGSGGGTSSNRVARWYVREIKSDDPTPLLEPTGKRYYEITSQAYNPPSGNAPVDCTVDVVCLRSVITRVYY